MPDRSGQLKQSGVFEQYIFYQHRLAENLLKMSERALMPVYQLDSQRLIFPPPELARFDGLLAIGGDLSPERLLLAYRQGIFPWYSAHEPILWWAPDPRLVLYLDQFHCSRRLTRLLRQGRFSFRVNQDFAGVIRACATVARRGQQGTWLGEEMIAAYLRLHELGYAHSVESWQGDKLAGGIYGVVLGKVFFGESMFSYQANASTAALAHLVAIMRNCGGVMIDCQISSAHLLRQGARLVPGKIFYRELTSAVAGKVMDIHHVHLAQPGRTSLQASL